MMTVEVRVSPPQPCGRCGREGLLTVEVPTNWVGGRDQTVSGMLPVVLCAHCDHDTQGAGALIAFLTVHEQITDDLVGQFAEYFRTWVQRLPTRPDPIAQADDEAAWRRGEFD